MPDLIVLGFPQGEVTRKPMGNCSTTATGTPVRVTTASAFIGNVGEGLSDGDGAAVAGGVGGAVSTTVVVVDAMV
ncbi:MAG: hypothetical protein OEM39_01465 [Acidimicrobiia bacterium]|nr:hypothetical protein [Acidimicrobiia bacterium]